MGFSRPLIFCCSATKIIVEDVFRCHAEVVEHADHRSAHRSGTAHVVFDVLGSRMVLEIGVEHHLMDKASRVGDACCIGNWIGAVQGQVEMEVGEVFLKLTEIVQIEDLIQGTGAVEIVHLAIPDVQSSG